MAQRLVFLVAISLTFFIQSCPAVTCYGYGGGIFTNNVICPGSNACCGATATCESNRLCHNLGDNNSTYIRGPCSVQPYDPNTCADICLYDEVSGFLPRVTPCADGSFCCNNDPQCCTNGRGVFLDSAGDLVASLPSSSSTGSSPTTTSSTSSASSTGAASSTTTTSGSSTTSSSSIGSISVALSLTEQLSPTASPTTSPSQLTSDASSSLSTGTKIGLGVGIPLGVLVLGILVITIWFQRRRLKIVEATTNHGTNTMGQLPQTFNDEQILHMQQRYPIPIQEMTSYKSPIMKENDCWPVELPAR